MVFSQFRESLGQDFLEFYQEMLFTARSCFISILGLNVRDVLTVVNLILNISCAIFHISCAHVYIRRVNRECVTEHTLRHVMVLIRNIYRNNLRHGYCNHKMLKY